MRTAVALRSDFEGSALRSLAKATKHAGQARRPSAWRSLPVRHRESDIAQFGKPMSRHHRKAVLRPKARVEPGGSLQLRDE